MEFINLKAQYRRYKDEIDAQIKNTLESAQFIMGQNITTLESQLCDYTGAKHAICCSSGTDALILSLMALDIGKGDEVITSPFSFIASVEAIMLLGATPVFVDIDEKTYNMDSTKLANAITKRTKAIIPVSIFGQMADMKEINAIAKTHNIPVIEDAAQSFGASFEDTKSCNASLIATTSFFPSKPLGCYGDGGCVFSNDDNIAQKLRYLLNHGQTERYKHSFVGLNARLDSIQAGILSVKLAYLDSEITTRQERAAFYDKHLQNVITPFIKQGNISAYAQYSVRTKDRDALIATLQSAKIPYAVHYPIPLHLQEIVIKKYGKLSFTVSEMICDEIISLPFSAYITQDEQLQVIEAING